MIKWQFKADNNHFLPSTLKWTKWSHLVYSFIYEWWCINKRGISISKQMENIPKHAVDWEITRLDKQILCVSSIKINFQKKCNKMKIIIGSTSLSPAPSFLSKINGSKTKNTFPSFLFSYRVWISYKLERDSVLNQKMYNIRIRNNVFLGYLVFTPFSHKFFTGYCTLFSRLLLPQKYFGPCW